MSNAAITVQTIVELLAALRQQADTITVAADLSEQMRDLYARQLPEGDRLGFDIGGRGMWTVVERGINHLQTVFSPGDKIQAEIAERVLGLYAIALNADQTTSLRLKQLDY